MNSTHVSRVTTRRTYVRALAAAILIAGAGLTACGGGSGGSSNASRSAAAGSGGGGGSTADSTKAVKYAECMRKNGVPEFPDPVDGKVQLKAKKGSALDPESPQFKAAEQACKAFAPNGAVSGGQADPAMLKFAQCMRKNGVPNFPDPDGGKLIMKSDQGIDPNSPQFKAAQKACQKLMPGGTP
jgi:hypothetical protein